MGVRVGGGGVDVEGVASGTYAAFSSPAAMMLGINYAGYLWANSAASIQSQINAAVTAGASRTTKWLVVVAPGTYDTTSLGAPILCQPGVDLVGATGNPNDVILTCSGNFDTVWRGGAEMILGWMTVRHTGANVAYAIHADEADLDGSVNNCQMVHIGIIASSESKSAIGIGLNSSGTGSQSIWLINCAFSYAGTGGGNVDSIFCHNNQALTPANFVAINTTTASAVANGIGCEYRSLTSTTSGDNFYWIGGKASGNLYDFSFTQAAPGSPLQGVNLYVDPTAKGGAATYGPATAFNLQGVSGVTVPMPKSTVLPAVANLLQSNAGLAQSLLTSSLFVRSGIRPSGSYYAPESGVTTAATAINRLYLRRFRLEKAKTLTDLACLVTTGQASTTVRLGVYLPDSTGLPQGVALYDSGAVDSSGTGVKNGSTPPSLVLQPGDIWLGYVSQGGTTQPSVLCDTSSDPFVGGATAAAVLVNGGAENAYYLNGVTGGLPSLGALTGITAFAPRLAVQLT